MDGVRVGCVHWEGPRVRCGPCASIVFFQLMHFILPSPLHELVNRLEAHFVASILI